MSASIASFSTESVAMIAFGLIVGLATSTIWFVLKARYQVPPNWARPAKAQTGRTERQHTIAEIEGLAVELAAAKKMLERSEPVDDDALDALDVLSAKLATVNKGLAGLAELTGGARASLDY